MASPIRFRLIEAGLVAAVLFVFLQTLGFDFAKVDDTFYVTRNLHVLGGPTAANLAWAFRSFEASNWHPLTWISLMIDAKIGGANPRTYHATNVLFHAANVLLLFHLLAAMTRSVWRSAFVAALFAVHPLHVESVAWITERKDVLSTFFWFLALAFHLAYARRPNSARYSGVLGALVLGLLSKPMVVTLPLTLLLLDYWPLGRLGLWTPLLEKLPLLALSLASSAVTLVAQSSVVGTLAAVPAGVRLENAVVSYATYVAKALWPSGLSIHYAFEEPAPWKVALSALALAGATWLALREGTRRRYLLTGWLWYIVTLGPVIGLVQVGEQSMADRYTYVPLIGLGIVVAWGVPDLMGTSARSVAGRGALALAAGIVVAALGWQAHRQAGTWRNAFELFAHAVEVDGRNALARMGLAQELAARGRDAEAIDQYREALKIRPSALFAHTHLAESLTRAGRRAEAGDEYREVLRLDPENASARLNLGILLMEEGRPVEAAAELERAARSRPADAEIRATIGLALTRQGKLGEAEARFQEALRIDPRSTLAQKGIAVVEGRTGRIEEAVAHLRRVLEADPAQTDARVNLARLLLRQGKSEEAVAELSEAARRSPGDPGVAKELDLARAIAGRR